MPSSPKNKTIAICHPQVPFIHGGAEVLVDQLTQALKRHGHSVDVITIPFKWYPNEEIIKNALVWRMLDIDVSETIGRPIDLVICTKFPAYLVKHPNKILWLCHQYRQAYDLYNTHFNEFVTKESQMIRDLIIELDNRFIREAKRVFTISQNVSNRLLKYNNIQSMPVYPGLKHHGSYNCKEYQDYVLFVSRITTIKRPDILLKSIKYVKNKKIKFVFVGKDEANYLHEFHKIVRDEGIRDRIELKTNYVSDEELFSLYANTLCVFFAPFDEDYGFVTLESFASKKPVITTTDAGGVLEFVQHGKNGFIIKPNDFQGIASYIDELSTDHQKAKAMGEYGHKLIKNITWDNVVKQLTDV